MVRCNKIKKTKFKIFRYNKHINRNQGSVIGTGQKLWIRAKIIPGGNMLLSKELKTILLTIGQVYYSKAKDCFIWDLDGKKFVDMSLMGVGTNILGYANTEVDQKVKISMLDGNMSTLNCPEEVLFAEKLIDIHPWADMVRLARTGGETNSIAIRIARAATNRDKVAIVDIMDGPIGI